jgi:hypothetical protein
MVQYFFLTTKQHQPAYQPQKPSAEQGDDREGFPTTLVEELEELAQVFFCEKTRPWDSK